MRSKSLAPQQARSRESLRKLLKAAAEVLGQHGVDGATIPRIAAHAGMTPGAVYRRFRGKETLLEGGVFRVLPRPTGRPPGGRGAVAVAEEGAPAAGGRQNSRAARRLSPA